MVVKGERETAFLSFFFFFSILVILRNIHYHNSSTSRKTPRTSHDSCAIEFSGAYIFPAEHFRTALPSPFLPIVTPWQKHPCPHSRSQLCCIHKQFLEPMGPELLQMMYNFTLCSSYLPRPILAARVFAE